MGKLISLFINDGKFVFRNSILIVLAVAPLIIIAFIRYLLPFITANYLSGLITHYGYIIALFCLMTAIFPAFAISFIMLDEKDENLFAVIRIMPISFSGFLAYRLSFVFIFGFFFSFLTLKFNSLLEVDTITCLGMAILFALSGPIVALTTITFASNKVEGLAILKGVNFLFILPLLGIFISSNWKFVLSIIPQFWVYQAFVQYFNGDLLPYFVIGIIFHLLMLVGLIVLFKKNIFRQK